MIARATTWTILRPERRDRSRAGKTALAPAKTSPHAQSPKLASYHRAFLSSPGADQASAPPQPTPSRPITGRPGTHTPMDGAHLSWPPRGVLDAVSTSSSRSKHAINQARPALSDWCRRSLDIFRTYPDIVQRYHSESRMSHLCRQTRVRRPVEGVSARPLIFNRTLFSPTL